MDRIQHWCALLFFHLRHTISLFYLVRELHATTLASVLAGARVRQEVEHERDDQVTVMSCTPLYQLERPSPQTTAPISTARQSEPTSARPKASSSGCGAMP